MQDSRGGQAAVDQIPLLASGTRGTGASAPGDGTTHEEDRSADSRGTGARAEEGTRGDAVVRLVDGVHDDVRWSGNRAGVCDRGTKVLGWSLVAFGGCVMCLTVYLTVLGD